MLFKATPGEWSSNEGTLTLGFGVTSSLWGPSPLTGKRIHKHLLAAHPLPPGELQPSGPAQPPVGEEGREGV